eukprot:2147851-Amphidinium_carterae.1
MTATAEQMQTLMQEMQRMRARLQTAEHAAAEAGARVQQTEQVRPRTRRRQHRGSKWLQEVMPQGW